MKIKASATHYYPSEAKKPAIRGTNWKYHDTSNELKKIANYLKSASPQTYEVEVSRIRFLYSNAAKKFGKAYIIGEIIRCSNIEKLIDGTYDYIILVYYPLWKDIKKDQKIRHLHNLLLAVSDKLQKYNLP